MKLNEFSAALQRSAIKPSNEQAIFRKELAQELSNVEVIPTAKAAELEKFAEEQAVFAQTPIEAYLETPAPEVEFDEHNGPLPDAELTAEEWVKEREFQSQNPPIEGDYLRTQDGELIRLEVKNEVGQWPFIFARAYVPNRIGDTLSWYVRSQGDRACFGIKCILLPKSVEGIIRRGGLSQAEFFVKELRVVKASQTRSSYLVEVTEWI